MFLPQTPTPGFDAADLLPMTFDRKVSSFGNSSVFSFQMETDAYAFWVEKLINSPIVRHETIKRRQRLFKTALTCSAAHKAPLHGLKWLLPIVCIPQTSNWQSCFLGGGKIFQRCAHGGLFCKIYNVIRIPMAVFLLKRSPYYDDFHNRQRST